MTCKRSLSLWRQSDKKAHWPCFPQRAWIPSERRQLEQSMDLPFLSCCTGDKDLWKFVLVYPWPCNFNLYFHPDSHSFAKCPARGAHTLSPSIGCQLSFPSSFKLRELSPPPLLLRVQSQRTRPSCPLAERLTHTHWPAALEGRGFCLGGSSKRIPGLSSPILLKLLTLSPPPLFVL